MNSEDGKRPQQSVRKWVTPFQPPRILKGRAISHLDERALASLLFALWRREFEQVPSQSRPHLHDNVE